MITATYRTSHHSTWSIDGAPKEQFVYHNAGLDGSGGSSYIDAVILRDRDANTAWESQADQTPEERVYYCQNGRADVVALMTSAGALINQVRYDPYGKPFGIAKTDLDADGDVDASDASLFATYHFNSTMPFADWNWDGTKNLSDQSAYTADKNADSGLGRGVPAYSTWSHAGAANRKLYAGYEIDPVLAGSEGWQSVYHVRHRVYLSQLGRWTRRDPLGYVDGMTLYTYGTRVPTIQWDPSGLSVETCGCIIKPFQVSCQVQSIKVSPPGCPYNKIEMRDNATSDCKFDYDAAFFESILGLGRCFWRKKDCCKDATLLDYDDTITKAYTYPVPDQDCTVTVTMRVRANFDYYRGRCGDKSDPPPCDTFWPACERQYSIGPA